MPTEAEELWMIAVITAPTSTPRTGLVNITIKSRKACSSARPLTASDICSIPNIRMPNPSRMEAVSRLRREAISMTMPTKAMMGEKVEGLSSDISRLSLRMPVRDKIHAVIVVPMLAPITTGMAWRRCMMPELTKPTIITVVAEEDWITAVTPAPSSTPLTALSVSCSKTDFSRLPARFSKASPMTNMPYRNIARPPIRRKIS